MPADGLMADLTGQVYYGINNIYTVAADGSLLQCRIKGKVLKSAEREYNPIAVGDRVAVRPDPYSPSVGWIVERLPRTSTLWRWNRKRNALQVIAANADILLCLTSAQSPPFRARFLDRLVISGLIGDLDPVIVLNKTDLGVDPGTEERIADFSRIGYRVVRCSAQTGEGLEEVREVLHRGVCVVAGQSGVGKSSLLNRLGPDLDLRIGEVSAKYDRGAHTTNFAVLLHMKDGTAVIDTPGIREFDVAGIEPRDLQHYFIEFHRFAARCAYTPCLHLDEPDCAVKAAVERGRIHPDRYESYIRLYGDMLQSSQGDYGSSYT